MKKYSKWFLILPLLLFSGCQPSNDEKQTEELSKADSAFTWQKDQERKFGSYNYQLSRDELEDDLKDRFGIELLPSFFELEEAYQDGFSVEGLTEKESDYQVAASDLQLTVMRENGFSNEEEYVSLGTSKAVYEFSSSKKQVKLSSQEIEILNWTGDNTFHGKSLEDSLTRLAEILQLDDVDQLMTAFNEKIADEEAIKGEAVYVYQDEEDAALRKILLVEYSSDAVVERIYARTSDNRS